MAIYLGSAKNTFTEATANGKLSNALNKAFENFTSLMKTSFEETFVEDGSIDLMSLQTADQRYTNIKAPSRRTHITQAPQTTVLFKKKQFSSLKSNYDTKYLDEDEKLYLRCIKLLHSRKCDEIAYHESLLGFNSLFDNGGFVSIDSLFDDSLEAVFSSFVELFGGAAGLSQVISTGLNGFGLSGVEDALSSAELGSVMSNLGFLNDLYQIKRKNDGAKASKFTKWIEEPGSFDFSGIGNGTGTIELNILSQINTENSLKDSGASFNISDPYQLLLISEADIEVAVRAAASMTSGLSGLFDSNASSKLAMARLLDEKLNTSRARRNQPEIIFDYENGSPVWNTSVPMQILNSDERQILAPYSIINVQDISSFTFYLFTNEEIGLINQVLRLMQEYSDTLLLSVDIFSGININISKLRNKMRKDFLGKHIIQSMDEVSVFVGSNTEYTNTASPIENSINSEKSSLSLSLIQQEAQEIAPNIPLALYLLIRDRKQFRSDGTCIFSGLVEDTSDSYSASSGEFNVRIRCVSNIQYLKMGRFTFKPGLNNTFGLVNDPLTPFELKNNSSGLSDDSNGLVLLPQNKTRLLYLYTNIGPNAGSKLKDEAGLINDKEEAFVIQHTPGLVYKWKEGILTATPQSPGSDLLRGINGSKISGQFGGFSVVNNPFAGMDAANIASILVCGMPYNYSTFLQSTLINSGLSSDTNNSRQFFNYLFDSVGRQGGYNGNFIPAKDSSISPDYASAAFEVQKQIKGLNTRISSLLSQRAKLSSDLLIATQANQTDAAKTKQSLIDSINAQLNSFSEQVLNAEKILPASLQISLAGNDIYIDEASRQEVDLQTTYKIKKKPEDVRYNKDKNFFVVSSKYDTEASIQAFVAQGIEARFDLWSAEYSTPYDIIERACAALNLEFFCDVNGNLILRPPQYNKIPLTLMTQLFKNSLDSTVPILPEFILNTLKGREENIRDQILNNELQLARHILSLGQISILVPGSSVEVIPLITIGENDIYLDDNKLSSALGLLGSDVFSSSDKIKTSNSLSSSDSAVSSISPMLIAVMQKQDLLSGRDPVELEQNGKYEEELQRIIAEAKSNEGVIFQNALLDKISNSVSLRQKLLRSLKDIVRKGVEASQTKGSVPFIASAVASFSPSTGANLLGNGDKISAFLNPDAIATSAGDFGASSLIRDLTEDDVNNVDGARSAQRFIIFDDKIISSEFQHSPPDFNQISVTGQRNLVGDSNGTIGGTPNIAAVSTDFDSWRQYGFRVAQSVHRPDFISSDDQCAPFGALALVRERQKMNRGSVVVIGNEYYKAGDNVYIQYRGMVYYVESVSHSISLNNGSFETTLSLSYGRALGEFIPTPNDLAGASMLANTSKVSKYRSLRAPISDQATVVNLGTVHFDFNQAKLRTNGSIEQKQQSNTTPEQIQALIKTPSNISALTAAVAKAQTKNIISNGKGRVEVRAYYSGYNPSGRSDRVDPKATSDLIASAVKDEFSKMISGGFGLSVDNLNTAQVQEITYKIYDLTVEYDEETRRFLPFPSEDAWQNPIRVKTGDYFEESEPKESYAELPVNAVDIVYIVDRKNRNKK